MTATATPAQASAVTRTAEISPCGKYRYTLLRWFHPTPWKPCAIFVMLNPSTADHRNDDPTIRRCMGFARAWGLGGVKVINLYAYRATKPSELWTADDPVGPENDAWLETEVYTGTVGAPVVAAWGVNAKPERVAQVMALRGFDNLQCLGVTKGGHPRHPLYVPAVTKLERWPS